VIVRPNSRLYNCVLVGPNGNIAVSIPAESL
jgi:hypothetical protein